MEIKIIPLKSTEGIYLISDEVLIRTEQDALDLMGNTNSQTIILHDYNFEPDFFDLSSHKLGAILQKFTNYQVRLAVIGDFTKYPSRVLPDFIRESNRHKEYIFVGSVDEVKAIWAK
jgi:hypothetical protein